MKNKKSIASILYLLLIFVGTISTIFSIIYSAISKNLFDSITNIYFILLPYQRICENIQLRDIVAFVAIILVTIFLLIMTGREILKSKNDKFPTFSFSLSWWLFICSFSSIVSSLLDFEKNSFKEYYYYSMLIYLVASAIMFSIEAIKHRKHRNKSNQIITYDKLRGNFLSGIAVLVIAVTFCCVFLYFNATTQVGKDLCNFMINFSYVFSLVIFTVLYVVNIKVYNKYKKQSETADVITKYKRMNILVFGSLAVFILCYFILKISFI